MKMGVTDIFPSSLKNKLTNLDKFSKKTILQNELVSESYGRHIIEGNNIWRLEPNFSQNIFWIKTVYKNDLLVDDTDYKMLNVTSQLPVNYILTKMTIYEYQTDPKSKLKLVVECLNEPVPVTQQNIFFQKNTNTNTNTNTNINTVTVLVPINFYFIYDNKTIDISEGFLKEEINVFLMHLN